MCLSYSAGMQGTDGGSENETAVLREDTRKEGLEAHQEAGSGDCRGDSRAGRALLIPSTLQHSLRGRVGILSFAVHATGRKPARLPGCPAEILLSPADFINYK